MPIQSCDQTISSRVRSIHVDLDPTITQSEEPRPVDLVPPAPGRVCEPVAPYDVLRGQANEPALFLVRLSKVPDVGFGLIVLWILHADTLPPVVEICSILKVHLHLPERSA